MADCFLKVRAHTESHPVYTKANLLLKALDQTLPSKSPSFYYAAILDMVQNPEELVQQEASVLLLACVLQSVPTALIQKEFSLIKSSILSLIRKDSPTLSKYSVKILERLLQVITREEWEEWGEKVKVFITMRDLTLDVNDSSRTQACSSLIKLLRKGLVEIEKVKQCICEHFAEILDMQSKHVKSETLVHAVEFLAVYLQVIPLQDAFVLTDKILSLSLMNLSPQVTTKAYLALETLFAGLNLPRDTLSVYLTNLLSAPVLAGGSEEIQIAYIQALTQALNHFNKTDSNECYKMLAQGFSTISEFLLSNQFNVQHTACSALISVILRCITPAHALELDPTQDLALSFDVLNIEEKGVKPIQKINAIMVYLLNERFHEILETVFPVISAYVQQLGRESTHVLQRLIIELDSVSVKWCSNSRFQSLMATLINTLGCERFFNILPFIPHLTPLESENFLEHSRSWILQVIHNELHSSDIVYFFKSFYSIAETLEGIQNEYLSQGLITSGNKYSILISQIWRCFPSFCNVKAFNADQQSVLQSKLPMLAKAMTKTQEIKQAVCLGLHKCLKAANVGIFTAVEDKFVPILFNNYLGAVDKYVLTLLKDYPISPHYAEKMVKRLIHKILEAKQGNKPKEAHLLMDLLVKVTSKLQNLETSDKEILGKFIMAYIESSDGKLQKKAYRMLKSLCVVDSTLVENLLITGDIKFCSEVSRKDRLKVYHDLILRYPAEKMLVMLNKYLLEIMHCIKSQSHKTRELCKTYLITIGSKLYDLSLFMNLWNSILAGLASNIDSTKSTSVDLLKILTKQFSFNQPKSMFQSELDQDNSLYTISSVISLLLKDPSKEVSRSSLKFFKATIPLLSETSALSLAPKILLELFASSEELQNSLKNYVKFVVEKLIRKCSYEAIAQIFPQDHLKFLHHVSREMKKKNSKAKKTEKKSGDDEVEMDVDEVEERRSRKKEEKRMEQPREWHFMNPLDLPAVNKVKRRMEVKEEFEMQDNKFVINEDDDDEDSEGEPKLKKKEKVGDDGEGRVKKTEKKNKPVAYIQYTPDMINKKKTTKNSSKVNKVVEKAKQGVLKGLKARRKKFS